MSAAGQRGGELKEGMATVYGYARVSSKDQNEDRQLIALSGFGVQPQNIYMDKQSGKDFDRPQYRALIKLLRRGDVLAVQSIDRLGRNYSEILEQWRVITKERRTDIVVLDMPLLDTRSKDRDLTGTLIADIVLQLLSYVAQTERESIRRRQREGIAAAHLRGVRFGAPHKPIPYDFFALRDKWLRGDISGRAAARRLGISPQTFTRWCAETEERPVE